MEIVSPYLSVENFTKSLNVDYRFGSQKYLNSLMLNLPEDCGKGGLMLFNRENFHFFRGKWVFNEKTVFRAIENVGHNGIVDFRVNHNEPITSNLIQGNKRFEQIITDIDGLRIFLPRHYLPGDLSFLRDNFNQCQDNILLKIQLEDIFKINFNESTNSLLLESKILEFLNTIVHLLNDDQSAKMSRSRIAIKMWEAKKYIDENWSTVVSIDQLSRYCGMNSCDLKKNFRLYHHSSIRQYLIRLRMEKAHNLLKSNDISVGEVVDMVGYSNRGHFAYIYKKYFGRLPSDEKISRNTIENN